MMKKIPQSTGCEFRDLHIKQLSTSIKIKGFDRNHDVAIDKYRRQDIYQRKSLHHNFFVTQLFPH